ncbi:hypothetical protein BDR03DRAFT_987435 [Suillus americanus]|nr:hypothetical protein BDR03DRAFT_987435 [Suillus americanus]
MPGTTISRHSSDSCSPSPAVLKKRYRGDLDKVAALKRPTRPRPRPATRPVTSQGKGLRKESPPARAPPPQAQKVKTAQPPAVGKIQSNYFLCEAARLVGCDLPARGQRHKVLQFISRVNREEDFAAFYSISLEEYNWLFRIIEALPEKPRLAYYSNQRKLIVEMPGGVHETVMNVIRPAFEDVARMLQRLIPGKLIVSQSHPNLTIKAEDLTFVPDFVHAINSCTDPPSVTMPVWGEITASQSETEIPQRLKNIVRAFPDTVMIFTGSIQENPPYSSPTSYSQAWQVLRSEPSIRSQLQFLSARTGERSLDRPAEVVVEGHCWCQLSAVKFQVWIRGSEPIDIDTTDPQLTAKGTLFPHQEMDSVTAIIERGLSLMKDRYVDISLITNPGANLDALRAVQIPLPFRWDDIIFNFTYSTQLMAYDRYAKWYDAVANGAQSQALQVVDPSDGPAMYTRSRTSARRGLGGGLLRVGRRK